VNQSHRPFDLSLLGRRPSLLGRREDLGVPGGVGVPPPPNFAFNASILASMDRGVPGAFDSAALNLSLRAFILVSRDRGVPGAPGAFASKEAAASFSLMAFILLSMERGVPGAFDSEGRGVVALGVPARDPCLDLGVTAFGVPGGVPAAFASNFALSASILEPISRGVPRGVPVGVPGAFPSGVRAGGLKGALLSTEDDRGVPGAFASFTPDSMPKPPGGLGKSS